MGDDKNPTLSMLVYTGDLGIDSGDAAVGLRARQVQRRAGEEGRTASRSGSTSSPARPCSSPTGWARSTFEGVQAAGCGSRSARPPARGSPSAGVVLALIGLLGSLFIRPRRVWVRARREGEGTMVEVAALDRSGNGEMTEILDEHRRPSCERTERGMSNGDVGDPQRPGDRGGRASSTSWPCWSTSSSGRRCASG